MALSDGIWGTPSAYLAHHGAADPVLFFSPAVLQATARNFLSGFPGLVTYAVKANPDEAVIENLAAAGLRGFDVASLWEIELIARKVPGAAMHFNNPVRSRHEIARAVALGVRSFSVDSASELAKLAELVPAGTEVSVRFKLPVAGAVYDFGSKFGADPETAAALLAAAAEQGLTPSLTFHPGTQCTDAAAWEAYIGEAARIAAAAGVRPARLNVGGGFPSHRLSRQAPELDAIFTAIDRATEAAFGAARPALVCEPGRGIVAEAFTLGAEIRAIRDGLEVFLGDGIYGGLAELPILGATDRIEVRGPDGARREGEPVARTVYGPTCDSLDRLPGMLDLPADSAEGDTVLFHGMGAYSTATLTRFNGFGAIRTVTVMVPRG